MDLQNFITSHNIHIYDAVEVIKDFYGEDFVDDSNIYKLTENDITNENYEKVIEKFNYNYILIYFPKIKVTNEYNKFTYIYDVYVKVNITPSGKIKRYFRVSKSTYTKAQALTGYIHSHVVPARANSDDLFYEVCLGYNGPISNFMMRLMTEDYCESDWEIFCVYLKHFLEIESLRTEPYIRLRTISKNDTIINLQDVFNDITYLKSVKNTDVGYEKIKIEDFVKYIAGHRIFEYNYNIDHYDIACSFEEFVLKISYAFVEYVNKYYKDCVKDILRHTTIEVSYSEGKFYYKKNSSNITLKVQDNQYLFDFKGKPVHIKIIDDLSKEVNNDFNILTLSYIVTIYHKMFNFINSDYGTKNKKERQSLYI